MACWTVSRFARSVLNTDGARRGNDINGRAVVDSLLEIMRTDPKVHAAVTTALANLVEEGLFCQMPEQGRALLQNIITLCSNPSVRSHRVCVCCVRALTCVLCVFAVLTTLHSQGHLLDLINTCLESPDFTSIGTHACVCGPRVVARTHTHLQLTESWSSFLCHFFSTLSNAPSLISICRTSPPWIISTSL